MPTPFICETSHYDITQRVSNTYRKDCSDFCNFDLNIVQHVPKTIGLQKTTKKAFFSTLHHHDTGFEDNSNVELSIISTAGEEVSDKVY
jgi:hypothetical protein